ncbi:MAG: hypothetical protein ACI8WY_002976, partial [Planctomycetota bacterium]
GTFLKCSLKREAGWISVGSAVRHHDGLALTALNAFGPGG